MDYKKTDIVGNKWHRFSQINISNPRVGIPSIFCTEQEVFSLDGTSEIIRDVGDMTFPFDPSKSFDILNPATGEAIGRATGAQVYALVYSYVMAEAMRRDAAQASLLLRAEEPAPAPTYAPSAVVVPTQPLPPPPSPAPPAEPEPEPVEPTP